MTEAQLNWPGRGLFREIPDEKITIEYIAARLTRIVRWAGHEWDHPITVAEHSLYVSRVLRRAYSPLIQIYGLLHDAVEAYTGDIVRPVKDLLLVNDGYYQDLPYCHWEEKLLRRIYCALRIPHPSCFETTAVQNADRCVGGAEHYEIHNGCCSWTIQDMSEEFIETYARLRQQARLGK